MNRIYVVSDGTGGTADRALKAALTQFSSIERETVLRPQVRSQEQIADIVEEAAAGGGFIVHTLVSDELRQAMVRAGRYRNVETIDLMGPLLARLSEQFSVSPAEKPGLFHQLNEEYFRRVETMEFALKHDDGMRIQELAESEIVLVGVSRTFKTPLSIYLAFKRWLVANVPIVPGVPPPRILHELEPGKAVGLTMNPRRLAELRQVRQDHLRSGSDSYANVQRVREEVRYALSVFATRPDWPVIDVTNKPIEEIASEILSVVGRPDGPDVPL
jgi:regulator of PEP synthase PpsR (kinase-PPPase family)